MSRKLIVYDNIFNEPGLEVVKQLIRKNKLRDLMEYPFAKKGSLLIDSTIQQLFASLLGAQVVLLNGGGALQQVNIDSKRAFAYSTTDWFAVISIDDTYSDNESLTLLADKENSNKLFVDEMTRELNRRYGSIALVDRDINEGFTKGACIPFKRNQLLLIEANLWHSIELKGNSNLISFYIKKDVYVQG